MNDKQIPRFRVSGLQQGKESVVGDCNGHSCQDRWEKETPAFARAISSHIPKNATAVLDFGCGVGRLAKAVLEINPKVTIYGVDASAEELAIAKEYVKDSRFIPLLPEELTWKVDLAYCVYVLQHVPAIELRDVIERIHYFLKPGGKLVYCSSDYRMAINQGGGFTDDRHLGVDIRKEVERLFEPVEDLFYLDEQQKIIKDLITAKGCPEGSIAHPAIVYRRRDIGTETPYFMAGFHVETGAGDEISTLPTPKHPQTPPNTPKRLILQNRLSPGDILVMTAAIRSLHVAHPGKFLTDVESPCSEIFENNPHITPLNGEGQKIDMHYPLISDHTLRGFHQPGAGVSGRHFSDGHRKFLEEALEIEIPRTGLTPELFLSQDEMLWPSPVLKEYGWTGQYWVINAGSKSDFPLKQYHRYQEVVDALKGKIQFVQVGMMEHNHPPLAGVIDMRGRTNHRELYRLIFHAAGVLTCVSYPMHVAAAFAKPCVVVAGGRESTRWELYPNQRFLHTNGALPCCSYDGCWKSKLEDCVNRLKPIMIYTASDGENKNRMTSNEEVARCMDLIKASMIVEAILMYYEGGMLELEALEVPAPFVSKSEAKRRAVQTAVKPKAKKKAKKR